MPRAMRLTLAVLAAVIVASGSLIGFFSWRNVRARAMEAANVSGSGVYEAMYIPIGGIDQWVQIRGVDRDNPVLLWLNGGPGFSTIPATAAYAEWEKHFTLVMWDQRGEGKTYEKYGRSVAASMSIDRMAADGVELAEYLLSHLHKEKIILLGHSWGSILGIHMVKERPELFYAYVGTGQSTNLKRAMQFSYPLLLERARRNKAADAIRQLMRVGPPPYDEPEKYWVPIRWGNELDSRETQSSSAQLTIVPVQPQPYVTAGANFSQTLMLMPMLDEDLVAYATNFRLPMIFIVGSEDLVTPEAQTYFDAISAPQKDFVVLPGAGHLAIFWAREKMLQELVTRVRPLAK